MVTPELHIPELCNPRTLAPDTARLLAPIPNDL